MAGVAHDEGNRRGDDDLFLGTRLAQAREDDLATLVLDLDPGILGKLEHQPVTPGLGGQKRRFCRRRLGDSRAEGHRDTRSSRCGGRSGNRGGSLLHDHLRSSGHLTGFQAGLDLYADQSIKAGIYVGQLEGDMSVKGFASGVDRKYVGFNNLRTRYLGVYGTWQDQSGLYADAVLQGADYRSDLRTAGDTAQARTKGSGNVANAASIRINGSNAGEVSNRVQAAAFAIRSGLA